MFTSMTLRRTWVLVMFIHVPRAAKQVEAQAAEAEGGETGTEGGCFLRFVQRLRMMV